MPKQIQPEEFDNLYEGNALRLGCVLWRSLRGEKLSVSINSGGDCLCSGTQEIKR